MSTKYKCLLADDSMLDRDALEMHLSKIENLYIEAVCSSGLEAAAILKEKNIDIVFSDIDMPDLSGLELIQSLPNPPVFIFISSYSEHAAESYSLDVIDFIVKPASLARLMKAANKAIEYIELKKTAANEQVESNSVPQGNSDFFYIKEDNGYARVNTSDLLYVESMGNFSRLQLLNQKKHLTLVSLKNLEEKLPRTQFMRVHKQYIINLQHIAAITPDGEVKFTEGQTIPIGAVYKNALMEEVGKKTFYR